MTPYYTVSTPANDIAATATDLRRNEYHLYKENLPDLNADIVLAANELACLTGRSDQFTQTIFSAFYRLLDLPKLTALQERLYHLDLFRLCAIDAVISKLNNPDDDTLNRIDEALTSYLTPTRQGQSLPSVAHIRRKLNTLVSAEDPEIKRKRKVKRPTYSSYPLPAGQGGITVYIQGFGWADSETGALRPSSTAVMVRAVGQGVLSPPTSVKKTTASISPTVARPRAGT